MNTAFEITPEDISTVFSQKFDENISLELCEDVLDNYIDTDKVEHEALKGNDIDEQAQYAMQEIHCQVKENWQDTNKHLNC